jgi:hypothetical protein
MSDIVERLRSIGAEMGAFGSIEREAADEIQRLRAENERMREALEGISKIPRSENAYGIIQVFARAALEEGKK